MRCTSCGVENTEQARFCMACAAPLAVEGVAERRERRVVSVLMADLQGFTSRSERLDVEDVDAFLAPYRDGLRRAVESTGGVVSDFAGDGMMAVFGAPVAHEDDAERAVRAAIAIRDSVLDPTSTAHAADLHVRLGVTSGEVLVTLTGDQVRATGDVVNTAARLEAAAPTDGVLVDEWTYRATSRTIVYADAAQISAKGKSEPVTAWQAIEPVSAVPEQARIEDHPLVGRVHEIQQLEAVLGRSWQEPSAQLVTLVGAPGIGKSRLVRELAAHVAGLAEPGRWLRGRSLAYGDGVAFWALGEIVKDVAGIQESDAADATEAKLARSVGDAIDSGRDRTWVTRHLRSLVGLEADTGTATRGEAFGAWRMYLEALAEQRPAVLVFEDIHWADEALLDFIDLLTERAGDVPLLIVCTSRPELFERRAGWGGGKVNSTTISLSPLTEDETARLVDSLLYQILGTEAVGHTLALRAEGNPLYAQEYVRMLFDRGLLQAYPSGWRLVAEPEGVPESVYGIIAARLDTLSEDERRFVHDAAVIGRTAWLGAVCALAGLERSQADDILHVLERKQLMRRVRHSAVDDDVEFLFGHALIQDVAYSQLRRTERADKHDRAAAWIEQLESGREDRAELIASHYQTALRLREQAGEDTTAPAARAAAALVAAGRQASAVNAYTTAVRHFEAAQSLMSADDPGFGHAAVGRAFAAHRAGVGNVGAALEAGYEAALSVGDHDSAAELALLAGDHIRESWPGGWDEPEAPFRAAAEPWWQAAEQLARQTHNSRVLGLVAYSRAATLDDARDHAAATTLAARAVEEAEQAGDWEIATLLATKVACSRAWAGDGSALESAVDAKDVLERHGSRYTEWAYAELSWSQSLLGDLTAAWHSARHGFPWAARFGEAVIIADADARIGFHAYHAGEWHITRSTARRYLDDPGCAVPAYSLMAYWAGALVASAEGEDETANACIEVIRSSGELTGATILEAVHLYATGHSREALATAERAMELLLTESADTLTVLSGAELMMFPTLHRQLTELRRVSPLDTPVDRAMGLAADSRPAEAAVLFEQLGSLPLAARARMIAAAQARERNHAEAAHHAALARSFYESVGATPLAAQAAQLEHARA